MAKRQNLRIVASDVVQGDGSYVMVRRVLWAQVIESQKKVLGAGSDVDVPTLETILANDAAIREMVRTHVAEWNWVDDAGEPLPLPSDAASFDLLSLDEVTFLVQALYQQKDELKN